MYRILRNFHLILGMAGVFFVLTYALSAVQMAHRVKLAPVIHERDLALAPGMEARAAAQQLMDSDDYAGELGNIKTTPAGFQFGINRAGTNYNVVYDRTTGKTHVRESVQGFMGMLNRLHHLNGLHHASGAMNAWGWALVFVSVTLLLLGATGIYMWFRLRKERFAGAVLLAINLGVSLALLGLLRAGI